MLWHGSGGYTPGSTPLRSVCEMWGTKGHWDRFLGEFAKLGKATISCPSVRMEHLGLHWTDFYQIWYLHVFRRQVEKIQFPLEYDKNIGYFTWRPIYIFDHLSLNSSNNEKCFRQKLYRKSKHTFCVQWLFSENRAVYEIMWEKYSRTGEATDDDMAHAHCMLDT